MADTTPTLYADAEKPTHTDPWPDSQPMDDSLYTDLVALRGQHSALQRAFDQQAEELQRAIIMMAEAVAVRDEYKRRLVAGGLL